MAAIFFVIACNVLKMAPINQTLSTFESNLKDSPIDQFFQGQALRMFESWCDTLPLHMVHQLPMCKLGDRMTWAWGLS